MKNRSAIALILMLMFVSCIAPKKRHDRIVRKYPFVHEMKVDTIRDTITLHVDRIHVDTFFTTEQLHDTIFVQQDRFKAKIFYKYDTLFLDAECDSVTIEKVVERTIPVTIYKETETWKKWIWILAIILLSLLIIKTISNHVSNSKN